MKSLSPLSSAFLGLLILASTVSSCEKSNDPEKEKSGFGKISYVAKASNSGRKNLSSIGNRTQVSSTIDTLTQVDVTWSSATVYVDKISFKGINSSLLDTTITVEKNLDLFNANSLAGVVTLPSGSYQDVAVKMLCRKSLIPGIATNYFAFHFKGTFVNAAGGIDSVLVGSSYPFEASLSVPEIVIGTSGNYVATFNFDLNKVLKGISRQQLQTAPSFFRNGQRIYSIFKGGSGDEPFYNQVVENWQNLANVTITEETM
ncbi:hypothetical protein [Pedobacter sp. GR22-6]|uniref:hypothetical protein n=1 Tax=Pedobacter sp. GR22-6 TaxID=3127957 RepID=UPI00307CD443